MHASPCRRALGATMLALGFALLIPLSAWAAYPPGPFPGPAPGGAFQNILTSAIICSGGGSLQGDRGPSIVTAIVPAGAFVDCTQITIYAAQKAVIEPLVPGGQVLVDSFALGWDSGAAAAATTATPVSLTIENPSVGSASKGYLLTSTGLETASSASLAGDRITFRLSSPTAFAVTMPRATSTPGTTPPPTSTLPIVEPDRGTPINWLPAPLLGVLAAVVLFLVLAPRRRRR
jgi:hypothetical protein